MTFPTSGTHTNVCLTKCFHHTLIFTHHLLLCIISNNTIKIDEICCLQASNDIADQVSCVKSINPITSEISIKSAFAMAAPAHIDTSEWNTETMPRLYISSTDAYRDIVLTLCRLLNIHVLDANMERIDPQPSYTRPLPSQSNQPPPTTTRFLMQISGGNSGIAYIDDFINDKPITLRGGDTIIKFMAVKYGSHSSLYPAASLARCMIDNKLWFNSNKLMVRMQSYFTHRVCSHIISYHTSYLIY